MVGPAQQSPRECTVSLSDGGVAVVQRVGLVAGESYLLVVARELR